MAKKTTSTLRPPSLPRIPNANVYGGITNRMNNIYNAYGNMRYSYKPSTFKYSNFGGRDATDRDAAARMMSDAASRQAAWNEQRSRTNRGYSLAANQANIQEAAANQATNAVYEQQRGRMANTLANSGLNMGGGAAAEQFGINSLAAAKQAEIAQQFALARAQAGYAQQNELGAVNAEQAQYQGGYDQARRQLADQLNEAAYQRWAADRARAFGEWGDQETRRGSAYDNAFSARMNQLGQMFGVLGQQASIASDVRDYAAQQGWNRYQAGYGAYQDQRDFRTALEQFNKQMSYQQTQDNRAWNQWWSQFKTANDQWNQQYARDNWLAGYDPNNPGTYTNPYAPPIWPGQRVPNSADEYGWYPFTGGGGNGGGGGGGGAD